MSSPTNDSHIQLKGRMSHVPLPSNILAGFDIDVSIDENSAAQLLPGGEGTTYHIPAANIVLKPTRDTAETELLCNILSQLTVMAANNPVFQISQPLRSKSGSFVHNGWSASRYIPNVRSLNQQNGDYTLARFAEILRVSDAFHASLQQVKLSDEETQRLRTGHTHVWARAHRAVWATETNPHRLLEPFLLAGRTLDKAHPYVELVQRLIDLGGKLGDAMKQNTQLFETAPQIIHGDLVGGDNILFPNGTSASPPFPPSTDTVPLSQRTRPAVIDLSPILAPASYAEGILLGDGLMWCGVGLEILDLAGGRTPQRVDMVRRGLLFRCLSDIGLIERGHDAARPDLVESARVTGLLEEEVASNVMVVGRC